MCGQVNVWSSQGMVKSMCGQINVWSRKRAGLDLWTQENSRQVLKTGFFRSILLFDTRIFHNQLGLKNLTGHKTLFYKNVDTGISQSGLLLRTVPSFYVSTFFYNQGFVTTSRS